ncbi:MAG: hypothetical protein U1E60_19730 [Reyranellaceae bacterium]
MAFGLLAAIVLAACDVTASGIGGAYYAPQYDYSEFFAVTDGRNFQVIMAGSPFPALPANEVNRRLLPVMQANKPRPNLTFTYEPPVETPQPNYRLVLVFDAANDLTAARVCSGQYWHKPPIASRPFNVFAVYCRNDLALSQTTAWSDATGPDDPRLGPLIAQLFLVVFSDQVFRRPMFIPLHRR